MQKLFQRFMTLMLALVLASGVVYAQTKKITGTVVDELGVPLIGAVVASQDGKNGTMTDENGGFSFDVRSNDQTVSVSFLGYLTQNVNISGKSSVKVQLLLDPIFCLII